MTRPAVAIDHVNIDTVRPEETIEFYRRVVGLDHRPDARPAFSRPGAWLFAGDRAVVHLNFHDVTSDTGRRLTEDRRSGAFNHIAFVGDDFVATCRILDELGINYRSADSRPGLKQIFLRDPNGVGIEINIEEPTTTGP
jgi:catechol 2,3-dioxygenase-like lactoylglutathione lyase family enzyme